MKLRRRRARIGIYSLGLFKPRATTSLRHKESGRSLRTTAHEREPVGMGARRPALGIVRSLATLACAIGSESTCSAPWRPFVRAFWPRATFDRIAQSRQSAPGHELAFAFGRFAPNGTWIGGGPRHHPGRRLCSRARATSPPSPDDGRSPTRAQPPRRSQATLIGGVRTTRGRI